MIQIPVDADAALIVPLTLTEMVDVADYCRERATTPNRLVRDLLLNELYR